MITLASLRWHILFLLLLGAAVLVWWAKPRFFGAGQPAPTSMPLYMAPAPDATWPWPGAKTVTLAPGVTQSSKVSSDGTMLDLFDFDFGANPRLRWEIFDQDEDDAKPLDNRVEYWNRNVAQMARQLDGAKHRGAVIAAWNGAFFGYDNKTASADAFHVSPVVLRGKVLFNTAQHRWTFGVKNTPTGPVWKTFFKPNRATMEREFDYAAGSVQCLIKDGKPLKVEPFPPVGGAFKEQPVPSTDKEAGHIPYFDHMKTCRASIGWSRDNKHLYFLAVKEPDGEGASSVALSFAVRGQPIPKDTSLSGGWSVADVSQFWQSKGVWGAINSDAGGVMQWIARRPNNTGWEMVPAHQSSNQMRVQVAPEGSGAPQGGGAIMYFFVREIGAK